MIQADSSSSVQAQARAAAFGMPIEQIDPSDPALFENDTVGHYYSRQLSAAAA